MDFGRATPSHVTPASLHAPFEALARFSLDGLAFIDERDRIAAWNDAAASITGISRERAHGAMLSELFANAQPLFERRDGRPHPVRLSPMHEPLRSIDAVYVSGDGGLFMSFGPQRRFDAIELVKNEILGSVSHELKTPIAVIKAFATTLRERRDATEASRADYLTTIEEQADALSHAVDELLLASKAQARDLPVRRTSVPVDTILDAALAEIRTRYPQRVTERHGSVEVYGDPDLLRDAFAQVLDNAFAYSGSAGRVRIDAARDGTNAVVRISDDGVGISAEALPYVFERFYRAEDNMTAMRAGTGLGLYIARAIVRAHGGSIDIESTPGHGTCVCFTIPERR